MSRGPKYDWMVALIGINDLLRMGRTADDVSGGAAAGRGRRLGLFAGRMGDSGRLRLRLRLGSRMQQTYADAAGAGEPDELPLAPLTGN